MSASHKIDTFKPSGFTRKCPYCDAWLTEYEFNRPTNTKGNALRCKFCRDGRIATDEMKQIFDQYQDIPEFLHALRHPMHPHYNTVRNTSRMLNSQIKFGHSGIRDEYITGGGPPICRINGELDFTIGDVTPGIRPRFGNYYAIDPATAMDLRQRNDAPIIARIDVGLLAQIEAMIREENWLAQLYHTAGERLDESPPPW